MFIKKDLLDTEYEYVLTFENGDVANITEEFILSKYKEKIGKDFKSIVLYFLKHQQMIEQF